jgi:hypothetical protein
MSWADGNQKAYMKFAARTMHFQNKPYMWNINLAPTCFGAAGAPSSGSRKDPDEIVRMLS